MGVPWCSMMHGYFMDIPFYCFFGRLVECIKRIYLVFLLKIWYSPPKFKYTWTLKIAYLRRFELFDSFNWPDKTRAVRPMGRKRKRWRMVKLASFHHFFKRYQSRCRISAEVYKPESKTTWYYDPTLWDFQVGWLQSFYQTMSWHSPRLEGKAVCFFANAVAHQRDGRCRAVTGRPSGLGKGAGTTVWTLSCKVCFCQIGCLWRCGNLYLILQVKIQYIHTCIYLHTCYMADDISSCILSFESWIHFSHFCPQQTYGTSYFTNLRRVLSVGPTITPLRFHPCLAAEFLTLMWL